MTKLGDSYVWHSLILTLRRKCKTNLVLMWAKVSCRFGVISGVKLDCYVIEFLMCISKTYLWTSKISFFYNNCHWNLLATPITKEFKRVMPSTLVVVDVNDDVLIWGQNSSGIYTGRSAYALLLQCQSHTLMHGPWRSILKLKLPKKICFSYG